MVAWTKKARLLLIALGLLGLGWITWSYAHTLPRYHGVPADQFIYPLLTNRYINTVDIKNSIKPMGAPLAVAAATRVLQQEDSVWRRNYYYKWYPDAPRWMKKLLPVPQFNPQVELNALTVLQFFGPEAKESVPVLIQMLASREKEITHLPSGTNTTSSAKLRAVLRTKLPSVTWVTNPGPTPSYSFTYRIMGKGLIAEPIITTLQKIGPAAQAAIPILCQQITSADNLALRAPSLFALSDIDLTGAQSLPALVLSLKSDDYQVRLAAAHAFVKVSLVSPSLVTNLYPALQDEEGFIRQLAAKTLLRMAAESTAPAPLRVNAVRQVINHGDEQMIFEALAILPQIQPHQPDSVHLLIAGLHHESEPIRKISAAGLIQYGPSAQAAIPDLRAATKDQWGEVREQAEKALKVMGQNVK